MIDEVAIDAAVLAAQRGPYTRVLIRDEDGRYGAEVIEFPGCYSSGDNVEDAVANLDEAIELWVEAELQQGQDIPPPLQETEFSGRLTLRLLPSIHERAALLAEREGVSLNRYLATAISFYVGLTTERDSTASEGATARSA